MTRWLTGAAARYSHAAGVLATPHPVAAAW